MELLIGGLGRIFSFKVPRTDDMTFSKPGELSLWLLSLWIHFHVMSFFLAIQHQARLVLTQNEITNTDCVLRTSLYI